MFTHLQRGNSGLEDFKKDSKVSSHFRRLYRLTKSFTSFKNSDILQLYPWNEEIHIYDCQYSESKDIFVQEN
jgi:hypothetical protein